MAFEECKLNKQRKVVSSDLREFSRNDGTGEVALSSFRTGKGNILKWKKTGSDWLIAQESTSTTIAALQVFPLFPSSSVQLNKTGLSYL